MPGGQSASRRGGGKAALDAAAPGRLGAGAVRPPLLPREHPPRAAPAQAVVEEGPQAARPRRSGATRGFRRSIGSLLDGARDERHHLVYLDEAHIHQDVDLGYGWGERGKRFQVASSSPDLKAKVSFYGLYLYNEGQVRIWPYDRAEGGNTIDVLRRLRAEIPTGKV